MPIDVAPMGNNILITAGSGSDSDEGCGCTVMSYSLSQSPVFSYDTYRIGTIPHVGVAIGRINKYRDTVSPRGMYQNARYSSITSLSLSVFILTVVT
jgi:hypothetical protein